jgi:hypothetical protein
MTFRESPDEFPIMQTTLARMTTPLLLAVCLLFAAVTTTRADDAVAEPPNGYREVLVDALNKVESQQWPEAMALFVKAHAMYPNARTLRGLAIVSFSARRYVDTLRFGRDALQNPIRPLSAAQREELEARIAESLTYVGRVALQLQPADAALSVDGQAPWLDEGDLLLDPGFHELVATAPGHPSVIRQVTARPGERTTLALDLSEGDVAAAPRPLAKAQSAEALQDPVPEQPKAGASRPKRVWTWVAAGTAVGFAALGVGSFISAKNEREDIEDTCSELPAGSCTAAERDALIDASSLSTKEALATTGLVVSLTAAAASVLLFWLEGRQTTAESGLAVGVGPGSVTLLGKF